MIPDTAAHHTPVMVSEVLKALEIRADGSYIDSTVGEGGHAIAVLSAVHPTPRLLGIDLDIDALSTAGRRLEEYGERVTLANGSFAHLRRIAGGHGSLPAEGVLFDLGLSSLQLQDEERGFSFSLGGRLDMRFDTTQKLTANELVNKWDEGQLADVIFQFGEEPRARRLAKTIVAARPIDSPTELANVIKRAGGGSGRRRIHPATRVFQALRIAVNRELENLSAGLEQAIDVLSSGGRLVVISYHSLEDRLVKGILRREASSCICPPGTPECICDHQASIKEITRRVTRPSPEEVRANPRSRSARMRVAQRL